MTDTYAHYRTKPILTVLKQRYLGEEGFVKQVSFKPEIATAGVMGGDRVSREKIAISPARDELNQKKNI